MKHFFQNLSTWSSHAPALLTSLLALGMLVLTPIWAFEYAQQPFLGILLEPNNVVSKIVSDGWPAAEAGVSWPERLIAVNGQPVAHVAEIQALLSQVGFHPLLLTFEDPYTLQHKTLSITPIRLPLWSFISLFLVPYLVGLVFLLIGLWAYRIRGQLRAGRSLLVFSASVSLATTTFFDMNTTHHAVELWSISLPLAASALIHLSLVFPKEIVLLHRWPATRWISWVMFFVFALPSVYELRFPSGPLNYIRTWQASYFFMALAILIFLAALTWRLIRSSSPVIRQQSRVIIFGAALALTPMMLFYLLPTAFGQTQEFQPAIYFPLLILLPLSITYAVLRYRLLDVDRVFANTLSYFLTAGLGVLSFFGLATALSALINRAIEPDNYLLVALYVLLLVVALSPAHRFTQRLIDRLFYRHAADYRRVLNALAGQLVITPDLDRVLKLIADQLEQTLSPERFVVYLYDDGQTLYLPHAPGTGNFPPCSPEDPLIRFLHKQQKAFYFPVNATRPVELQNSEFFNQIDCIVFVPLHYEGTMVGVLMLGQKRSGEPYSRDDLEFLETVAGQCTLALENARLFVNLRHTLDQTLEMKNLMDDIFASIATGVITTDIEHKITLFNRAAERILGIPFARVSGKPLSEAFPVLPDLSEVASEAVERGSVVLSREIWRNIPPRGELCLRVSCSPVRDAYFATKGAAIVLEDLTERRKLEAEQERIRQTFGRVVAPRVRDRLLAAPSNLRLDGTRQPATILFADIAGFSTSSEQLEPETLFRVLNHYLSLAAQSVLEEEGTLDKFLGDGVLAIWNAPDPQPDHALRAVRAALTILTRAEESHREFTDTLYHWKFRIGISSGDVIVGNVGTNELFNYTAIGDTVNIAQRLETLAGPGEIMIDQTTYLQVKEHVQVQSLESVMVKGRAHPVQVYRLLGMRQYE
ncbi:MAG: GAF domain-containing protein [Anaerolineales bacterium]|nr:GAF domain-containing protein [Anaerolineales bacterium]MCX7608320.1 GAF domain-containing protein [Anaerolineales bacterium]